MRLPGRLPSFLQLRPACTENKGMKAPFHPIPVALILFLFLAAAASAQTAAPKTAVPASPAAKTATPAAKIAAAGTAAGTAVPGSAAVLATGTPAAAGATVPEAGAGAGLAPGAAAVLRGGPPKIDGWPLCLFHASQSRTSDIVKTTQSRVRRISVMGGSGSRAGRHQHAVRAG